MSRLPAFYLEGSGCIATLVEVAEDLLRRFSSDLGAAERGALQAARGGRLLPGLCGERASELQGDVGSRMLGGTIESVTSWFAARVGCAPRIWSGLWLVPQAGGWLEFSASREPSAVLLWEKRSLPAPPEDLEIPPGVLPVATRVQAVLAARPLSRSRPLAGERIQGSVLWSRTGGSLGDVVFQGGEK